MTEIDIANPEQPIVRVTSEEEIRLNNYFLSAGKLADNCAEVARTYCESSMLRDCGLTADASDDEAGVRIEFHCDKRYCTAERAGMAALSAAAELYSNIRQLTE